MRKIILAFLSFFFLSVATAQDDYTILLTGASFASPDNGWFEYGCREIGAAPVNRAVGGYSIVDAVNQMHDGTLYAKDELETLDALVIMHVHDRNVFDGEEAAVHAKWEEYGFPFDRGNYTGAYDYVIKRYISDCYNLRSDPYSKYYNSRSGKPAVIVLCTHWHDSRTVYNRSVRQLAEKWGLPLVEFDKWIGFSKNTLNPLTGEHFSQDFSGDRERSGEEVHGWHPEQGDTYIQKKMAAIFADVMRKVLPLR